MKKQKEFAYCSHVRADVSLKDGFHQCMVEHQCFSDEPCPLDGRFPAMPVVKKQPATKPRGMSPQA